MKKATNKYRRAVTSNREFLYEAKITFADGRKLTLNDKDDLRGDGISITSATSGIDSFDIGAAVIGELTMTLNNSTEKFDVYDFLDAHINLKIGLRLEGDTAEYLQMGVYTVDEANFVETTVTLSALDKMSWFERKYSEVGSVYPITLFRLVTDICNNCGVPFSGTSFTGGDRVIKKRPEDAELSCLQMISYAAQVAGCYATIAEDGRLAFRWYDTSVFEEMDSLDGGRLKNAATGDDADGGNFKDYSSGDTVDGGTFVDQRRYAHIYAMSSMQVATDEIVITGIRVAADEEETEDQEEMEDVEETESLMEEENTGFLCGEEGYVLFISENPLIDKDMEKSVAEELGNKIIGMKIRTFSVSALSDPAIEAGDCAYVSDRKGNSYPVYITNTAFKLGNYEELSCGAQSPARNRMNSTTAETKIQRLKSEIIKQFTAYDTAVQQLTELMVNSFGVFKTEEKKADGPVIYYMHDKPSVVESKTIWKMVSGAIAVSTDGGETWNAGVTADGNMIAKVLSVIGINADWIDAGEISSATINIGKNSFTVDKDGNVKITKGSITIGDDAFTVDADGNMVAKNAEITGTIIGKEGFSLEYVNSSTRPPIKRKFAFTGIEYNNPYKVMSDSAFLSILSPSENSCILIGTMRYGENKEDGFPEIRDTVYFPKGAIFNSVIIEHATIKGLFPTHKDNSRTRISADDTDVLLNRTVSGSFVSVYGTYRVKSQKAGKLKKITVGKTGDVYIPTNVDVSTIGAAEKTTFMFTLTTDGKFTARNISGTDFESDELTDVEFRFDFFRFADSFIS